MGLLQSMGQAKPRAPRVFCPLVLSVFFSALLLGLLWGLPVRLILSAEIRSEVCRVELKVCVVWPQLAPTAPAPWSSLLSVQCSRSSFPVLAVRVFNLGGGGGVNRAPWLDPPLPKKGLN